MKESFELHSSESMLQRYILGMKMYSFSGIILKANIFSFHLVF
jgi:hypothetical protein